MKLTKGEAERYRSELGELSERAGLFVSGQLLSFMDEFPKATVAEIREEAKAIIEDALGIYGDQAAVMAADFFEEVMEAEGVAVASEIYDTIDRDQMDSKVRYFARDLVEGNLTGFALKTSDVTRYYVKRQAYDNMVRNCYENDVRYARVPSGSETCGFCFMLCSRGFVYHTEKAAKGKSNHGMHNHCDCIIVPGVEGVTKIEGYDPESMMERWEQCRKTCGSNKPKDIMQECETRDPKWLYVNKEPEIDYSAISGKERKRLAAKGETNGHEKLRANGFKVVVNKEDSDIANIDVEINGQAWELKSIQGGGSKINGRFDEAMSKWKRLADAGNPPSTGPRVILDNSLPSSTMSDEKAIEAVKRNLAFYKNEGLLEVLYISRDGAVKRFKA